MPGIDDAMADRIVASRGARETQHDSASRRHALWLLTDGLVDLDRMRGCCPTSPGRRRLPGPNRGLFRPSGGPPPASRSWSMLPSDHRVEILEGPENAGPRLSAGNSRRTAERFGTRRCGNAINNKQTFPTSLMPLLAVDWDPPLTVTSSPHFRASGSRVTPPRPCRWSTWSKGHARIPMSATRSARRCRTRRLGGVTTLVGVDRSSVELLQFSLPPAQDSELPEMVANQAMRESPQVTEKSILDFVPLDEVPSARGTFWRSPFTEPARTDP